MTISQLVSQGKLKEAIALLSDNILLSARLNRLLKDERMGTISNENANLERNRIVQAILYYAEEQEEPIQNDLPFSEKNNLLNSISEFYQLNKRGNYKSEIEQLLEDVENYEQQKRRSTTFDRRGGLRRNLEQRFESLKSNISEIKGQSTDNILQAVEGMLDDGSKIAINQAIIKLKLISPESTKLESLQQRLTEVGDMISHRTLIIEELDIIISNL